MPQNVPAFEWTDEALRLRHFMFEFWALQRRPPNLRDCHEGTGLDRRQIIQAYKELQLGIVVVIDADTQNCNLLKAPPFSAFPSQVAMFLDGSFHSWIGCAHEAVAVSNTPYFRDKDVRLESYCSCCLEPITLVSRNYRMLSTQPADPLIHVSLQPWDWVNRDMTLMCDATNFVIDRDHADRYERQIARRGIVFTIDQVAEYVAFVANARIHDYHWAPLSMDPSFIIERLTALGIDLSPWGM